MQLLLGKPTTSYATAGTAPDATEGWTPFDTARQGTTTLNTTDGQAIEAKEEGGEVIERIEEADSFNLEFELFVKKGHELPFNGKLDTIPGEFAFKVESAIDANTPSFYIPRATIAASLQYTANDGLRVKYTISALKPATGNTVQILGTTNSANGDTPGNGD